MTCKKCDKIFDTLHTYDAHVGICDAVDRYKCSGLVLQIERRFTTICITVTKNVHVRDVICIFASGSLY